MFIICYRQRSFTYSRGKGVSWATKPVSIATASTAGSLDHVHMMLVICMCVIMYVSILNIISVSRVSVAPSGSKAGPRETVGIAGDV